MVKYVLAKPLQIKLSFDLVYFQSTEWVYEAKITLTLIVQIPLDMPLKVENISN